VTQQYKVVTGSTFIIP